MLQKVDEASTFMRGLNFDSIPRHSRILVEEVSSFKRVEEASANVVF